MKFTEAEIAIALANWSQLFRQQCCIPNVSWGAYVGHECDFVSFTSHGVLTEYEIKTTWPDWKNDWVKSRWNTIDYRGMPRRMTPESVSRYYYVVPRDVYQAHKSELGFPLPEAGIITYFRDAHGATRFDFAVKAKTIPGAKPLKTDAMYKFARLGVIRYWTRLKHLTALVANYAIKSRTVVSAGGDNCRMKKDCLCLATGSMCRNECDGGITLVSEEGRCRPC